MNVPHYRAVIEAGPPGSGFDVVFPDFPGCVSAGSTVEEALANAAEALLFHMEGMVDDGEPIPEPSPLDAPLPDWLESNAIRHQVLVPVEPPGKSVRVNVTIDESLLARIDRAAATRQSTRSGFLADAARRLLREQSGA